MWRMLQSSGAIVLMAFDVASAAMWENLKTTCTATDRLLMWRTTTTVVAVHHIMLQQL
jgi:hypothetical protein